MRTKVSYSDVQQIRRLLSCGTKQAVIARQFGVSQSFISKINRGRRKSYLSVVDDQRDCFIPSG